MAKPQDPRKVVDRIIGKGLITAETIAQELRAKLLKVLSERSEGLQLPQLLRLARDTLRQFQPILAQALTDAQLASWIAGLVGVAGQLPATVAAQMLLNVPTPSAQAVAQEWAQQFQQGGKPPIFAAAQALWGGEEPVVRFPALERAIQSTANRGLVTHNQLERLSAAARAKAFKAAEDQTIDTQAKLRDVLATLMADELSLPEYKRRLKEELGTSAVGPARIETIYRTNVQTAFTEGHDTLADHPVVQSLFPYAVWSATHDARVRPEHLALEKYGIEGTAIYRTADPFWEVFSIPIDFNCRCTKYIIDLEKAAAMGLREAKRWLKTGQEPPLESRLPYIPFRPAEGFGNQAA